MKILILTDNFLNGGMERHIEGYIENMKNHEFYLAVTNFKDCEVISNSIDLDKFTYKKVSHDSHRWALVSRLDYDKTPGIKNMLSMIERSRIKYLDIYGMGNGAIDLFNMYEKSNFSFELNLKGIAMI